LLELFIVLVLKFDKIKKYTNTTRNFLDSIHWFVVYKNPCH